MHFIKFYEVMLAEKNQEQNVWSGLLIKVNIVRIQLPLLYSELNPRDLTEWLTGEKLKTIFGWRWKIMDCWRSQGYNVFEALYLFWRFLNIDMSWNFCSVSNRMMLLIEYQFDISAFKYIGNSVSCSTILKCRQFIK